jgi:taurine dioxygenase
LRNVTPTIGTEVLDVDVSVVTGLSGTLSRADIDELRSALARRHLLLVRGPMVTGEQQLAFAARFGPLLPERQLWGYVSNVREDGIVREGNLPFHSDFAFTEVPTGAICLHALQVPEGGAPTIFADAVRAATVLPKSLRARLVGRRVTNAYDLTASDEAPMRQQAISPHAPRYDHPVLGRHPATGAEVVMANDQHSLAIVGLPQSESDALLADLFAVLYDGANLYEHQWRVGDLLLWDNVALQHGRRDFPRQEARTLQRVTLGAYTPGELLPQLSQLLAARHGEG